jgi:hypothetical protein
MNRHLLRIALISIAAIAITTPLGAQQRGGSARSVQPRGGPDDTGPRPQAFSVSLVLGEMQASAGSDNVPTAARKALTDVKDFLPYKTYRLLDSQWTLCCGRSSMVSTPIVSRLRGPEDQDYTVEIVPSNAGNGKYYVHFSLWEPRSTETTVSVGGRGTTPLLDAQRAGEMQHLQQAQRDQLAAQRVQLEQQLAEMRRTLSENHPDVAAAKTRIEALERSLDEVRRTEPMRRTLTAAAGRRAIIDTSFTMDIGETVVVGTSRLKGDKALIALLTAVASTKSPAR